MSDESGAFSIKSLTEAMQISNTDSHPLYSNYHINFNLLSHVKSKQQLKRLSSLAGLTIAHFIDRSELFIIIVQRSTKSAE